MLRHVVEHEKISQILCIPAHVGGSMTHKKACGFCNFRLITPIGSVRRGTNIVYGYKFRLRT